MIWLAIFHTDSKSKFKTTAPTTDETEMIKFLETETKSSISITRAWDHQWAARRLQAWVRTDKSIKLLEYRLPSVLNRMRECLQPRSHRLWLRWIWHLMRFPMITCSTPISSSKRIKSDKLGAMKPFQYRRMNSTPRSANLADRITPSPRSRRSTKEIEEKQDNPQLFKTGVDWLACPSWPTANSSWATCQRTKVMRKTWARKPKNALLKLMKILKMI